MILEKMRSCLRKLEPGFWTYSLITPLPKALGLNCPNLECPFQALDHKHQSLGIWKFFISRSIKFCIKYALIFKFWTLFDKVISVYSQKIAKIPFKNLLFGAISDMQDPSKSSLKTLFFGALKFKYLCKRLAKFEKWAHSEILSLRAFIWCKNQIILIRYQFWQIQKNLKNIIWHSSYESSKTSKHNIFSVSFIIFLSWT